MPSVLLIHGMGECHWARAWAQAVVGVLQSSHHLGCHCPTQFDEKNYALPVCGCEMRPVVVHAKGLRNYVCGFSHSGCVYVQEVLSLWPCRESTATHVTKLRIFS